MKHEHSRVALTASFALYIGCSTEISEPIEVTVQPGVYTRDMDELSGRGSDRGVGSSVALSGNSAIVGAPGSGAGSAYVYARSGGTWPEERRLAALDGVMGDQFGASVTINGNRALVGAPRHVHSGVRAGAAYVFERAGEVWTQIAKLTASDAATADRLGETVALHDDRAFVGAPGDDSSRGSAYLFQRRLDGVWVEIGKFTAAYGSAFDQFGYRLAFNGTYAVIGAPGADPRGFSSGSAYVFFARRIGIPPVVIERWEQAAKLVPSDGEAFDQFGSSVALSGSTALVGAPFRGADAGAAYTSVPSASGWSVPERLAFTSGDETNFGYSVALDGNTALIGAPGRSSPTTDLDSPGITQIFTRRSNGAWTYDNAIFRRYSMYAQWYGSSVALEGGTLLIGAPGDLGGTGKAFLYSVAGGSCEGFCGGRALPDGCWCDSECSTFGDCCPDFSLRCE